VALEYCIYRDVLRTVNPELNIREIRITGGGEKSDLWNQMKADALGIPLVQVNRHEGAPMGAALLAGFGVGLCQNLDDAASRWVRKGDIYRPNRQLEEHYQARLARYTRLLSALNQWAENEREGP
jgi:xylulokinase